jgi:hypothetical protein
MRDTVAWRTGFSAWPGRVTDELLARGAVVSPERDIAGDITFRTNHILPLRVVVTDVVPTSLIRNEIDATQIKREKVSALVQSRCAEI